MHALWPRPAPSTLTLGSARVSRADPKDDLRRQPTMREAYCAQQGWPTAILTDRGRGLHYQQPGLQRLLELILQRGLARWVRTHRDRLLRFGSERVFALCEPQGIAVVVIHPADPVTFEEELAADVLEIMTVFSARRMVAVPPRRSGFWPRCRPQAADRGHAHRSPHRSRPQ